MSEDHWVSGEETDRAWKAMLEGRYEEALQILDRNTTSLVRNYLLWISQVQCAFLIADDQVVHPALFPRPS